MAPLEVRSSDAERDRSICRVQVRRRPPGRRYLVATGWLSPSCSEGDTPVVAIRLFWLLFCLAVFRLLVPCRVCRRWPTAPPGFPEGVPCVPVPAGLVLVTSQLCRFCGDCPACSLFARCSALEGLSHLEVLSVSWDPHPREPVEGVLRATSVLELAAHFLTQTRQSFVSLPLSALVPEPRSGARREAAAWPGCGVACVGCFCGGSVSPFARAEAGARLVSGGRGQCVPLLAASGGGLVAVVVTTFSSRRFQVFPVALACTVVIAWPCLFRSRVPVRGGTGVCGLPTSWRVQGPEWFCVWALDPVEAHPPYFLQLGARRRGSSVSDGLRRRLWRLVVVSSSESERCETVTLKIRCAYDIATANRMGYKMVEGRVTRTLKGQEAAEEDEDSEEEDNSEEEEQSEENMDISGGNEDVPDIQSASQVLFFLPHSTLSFLSLLHIQSIRGAIREEESLHLPQGKMEQIASTPVKQSTSEREEEPRLGNDEPLQDFIDRRRQEQHEDKTTEVAVENKTLQDRPVEEEGEEETDEEGEEEGGQKLQFTAKEVALIIGLLNFGEKLNFFKESADSRLHKLLPKRDKVHIKNILQAMQSLAPSNEQQDIQDFVGLWIALLCASFLFTTTAFACPVAILHYVNNMKKVNNVD
ncbi:hypothetical protein Taro_051319 [Colocasia esculenta]|uniref:Uncharacterized protein n=1 Tax=Colocasia esculenta TaxID=4460 RepID=A0A843XGI4_COLES|nr:hypothetical protein [Colocasia esculenta]